MDLLALIEEKGSMTVPEIIAACDGDDEEATILLLQLYREHKVVLVQGETYNMIMSTEAYARMIVSVSHASQGLF